MEWFVQTYLSTSQKNGATRSPTSVLEVGSYDYKKMGTYRDYFDSEKFAYTGLDISAGPNVDIVLSAPYDWSYLEDASYDVVISGQAFEHIEFFWITLGEMARVLKPGGLTCIIAPRGRGRHRNPVDVYRFDVDGMVALAKYSNLIPLHASTNLAPVGSPMEWYSKDESESDSMLVAQKPVDWKGLVDPKLYVFAKNNLEELATGFVTWEKQI
jgi:SAM-dependent methyltransferase